MEKSIFEQPDRRSTSPEDLLPPYMPSAEPLPTLAPLGDVDTLPQNSLARYRRILLSSAFVFSVSLVGFGIVFNGAEDSYTSVLGMNAAILGILLISVLGLSWKISQIRRRTPAYAHGTAFRRLWYQPGP